MMEDTHLQWAKRPSRRAATRKVRRKTDQIGRPACRLLLCLLLGICALPSVGMAQNFFSSGSTGADGAFAPASSVTIDMSTKPDGIWNYTTIDIPADVTVTFTRNAANTPVVWLATGDVNIAGTVDVSGENASSGVEPGNEALGGPGGFKGGLGARRTDISGSCVGNPGEGPGGGSFESCPCRGGGGGYGTSGLAGCTGSSGSGTYGNQLIRPLVGGSGGGGGSSVSDADGANGGGGGGAILIASSGTITIDGTVIADGGSGSNQYYCGNAALCGGGGSGGAVRLIANRVDGEGNLLARGGPNCTNGLGCSTTGGAGRIRVEAYQIGLTNLGNPQATFGPPLTVGATADRGTITITDVAGEVVPILPTGNTGTPDVIFMAPGDVLVSLATTNIPEGTNLTVRVNAAGQVITAQSTPVDAAGNATATVTVPAGLGTIQAYAEFVPTL